MATGLVVMGEDSFFKGCEFESRHHIQDGHFSHLFAIKMVMCFWKDENKWKRGKNNLITALNDFFEIGDFKAMTRRMTRPWELQKYVRTKSAKTRGCGCGAVGRAVAFDIREPRLKNPVFNNFINYQLYWKETGNGQLLKCVKW